MAKFFLLILSLALISCFTVTTTATTYIVGDTSGWDISSNFDTWISDKNFQVGDVLVFQYTSSDSVCEVTRKNFQTCNTTNVISRYSTGNTTVSLTKPGTRYFVDGNRLYCMGGMKLQVNVQGNDTAASSPIGAPQAQPAAVLPASNSKNGDGEPVATSDGEVVLGGWSSLVMVLMCLMCIDY